jgi:hypothetical protein
VFEHHHEKKAFEQAQAALGRWQAQRDSQAELVNPAATYTGSRPAMGWC